MVEAAVSGADDRLEIIETANAIGLFADLRDWDALRDCFCDEVELSYGGQARRLSSAELVDGWRFLGEFAATEHQVTNHKIELEGDRAHAQAHVVATHHMPEASGEPFWICGGNYDYGLRRTPSGWRVEKMTFTLTWSRGNGGLIALAQERRKAKVEGGGQSHG